MKKKCDYRVGEYIWVNGPFGWKDNSEGGNAITGPAVVIKTSRPEKMPEKLRKVFSTENFGVKVMGLCQKFLDLPRDKKGEHNPKSCSECKELSDYPLWIGESDLGGSLYQNLKKKRLHDDNHLFP